MNLKLILKVSLSFLVLFLVSSLSASAYIYDDFNDNQLDLNKWYIVDATSINPPAGIVFKNAPITEANGVLNIDPSGSFLPPTISMGVITSTSAFQGDFDFRAEWENMQTALSTVGMHVGQGDLEDRKSLRIYINWSGQNSLYRSEVWTDAYTKIYSTSTQVTPADISGYFGLERKDSFIRAYFSDYDYPDYADWNLLLEYGDIFTEPVHFSLIGFSLSHTSHIEFDNAEVRRGDIVAEPATLSLLGLGLLGLAFKKKR